MGNLKPLCRSPEKLPVKLVCKIHYWKHICKDENEIWCYPNINEILQTPKDRTITNCSSKITVVKYAMNCPVLQK